MVKIGDDFNKMLDRYLEERQQSRPTDFIIRRKKKDKVEEKVPELRDDEIVVEEREPSFFEKLFGRRRRELEEVEDELEEEIRNASSIDKMEEEFEELEEAEQIIEEKKMGLFRRILERIKSATVVEDEESAPEEEVVYDEGDFVVPPELKEVLKIQNEWLKKLPPRVMSEFKSSDDFRRYQEILRKYGLIK